MHEKHGDITDETPQDPTPTPGKQAGCCGGRRKPPTKQASDSAHDHPSTRVADAVKAASKK